MPEEVKQDEGLMTFNLDYLSVDDEQPVVETKGKAVEKPKDKDDIIDDKPKFNLFNDNFLAKKPDDSKEDKVVDKDKEDEALKEDLEDKTPPPNDIEDNKRAFSVVLGQGLVEGGVLTSIDEEEIAKIDKEEGEEAALQYMIKKQIDDTIKEIRESDDKGYQDYKSLIEGGLTKEQSANLIDTENYVNYVKNLDLSKDDEESTQHRKDVLTMAYKIETTWSDEKISKYVDKLYDEGNDLAEIEPALKTVDDYIKSEKESAKEFAKTQAENAEKAYRNQIDGYKTFIDKNDEYFQGEKVSKATKDKMFKSLTKMIKLDDGRLTNEITSKRLEDPTKFDAKVAYLYAIGWFDDKPIDKIAKKAETKATSRLQEAINDRKGNSYKQSMGRSFSSKDNNLEKNPFDKTFGI